MTSTIQDEIKAELERLKENQKWLAANPHFDEKPATIKEFLGGDHLDIIALVRPGLVEALEHIFGDEVDPAVMSRVRRGMFTGAIGIGKTTFASIVIPYMVHWVLCLRDPQGFYKLLPGSRIAFMQMSTSDKQAKEVLFGDIKARIAHGKWFNERNYQPDPNFKNQLRFPKDIWVLPGNSAETTFEGYNILGGILDEMDSHQITNNKDYAEVGYDTIHSRIDSRFGNNGLLLAIGQMKKGTGFAAKKYKEMLRDDEAYVVRMTIWESFGWHKYLNPDGTRASFWYDTKRKEIITAGMAALIDDKQTVIEVPNTYRKSFENNPEKALRDLAGVPPEAGDPFISLTYKVDEARNRWIEHHGGLESPVDTSPTMPTFAPWFIANHSLRRTVHIDLAFSAEGDALGLAMGHVPELVDVEGEEKPYIVFDFLLRWKAAPGTEIFLGDVRRTIYDLIDHRNFKISKATMDGFQSTDTMQQLRKRRIAAEYVSVDKTLLPYHDLREALYEDRIEFPKYMTFLNRGDTEQVEIAARELMQLEDTGKKVDHPVGGSKDVTDAMAGVCYTLMGDRNYRRGANAINVERAESGGFTIPQLTSDQRLGGPGGFASMPPVPSSLEGYDRFIPKGMQGGNRRW
jgi:hypothetical protein